jgi:hypothetical protein
MKMQKHAVPLEPIKSSSQMVNKFKILEKNLKEKAMVGNF